MLHWSLIQLVQKHLSLQGKREYRLGINVSVCECAAVSVHMCVSERKHEKDTNKNMEHRSSKRERAGKEKKFNPNMFEPSFLIIHLDLDQIA